MSELKVGDVVVLKSGGPEMIIEDIGAVSMMGEDGGPIHAWVTWLDKKDHKQKDTFALTSLKKHEPKQRAKVKFVSH